jgi:hypothetical protein
VSRPDYPQLRPNGTSPPTEIALVVNGAVSRAAFNWVYDVPVEAGADMATLVDDRIHPYSMLIGEPDAGITGHTFAAGVAMISVAPGPARFLRIGIVG